MQERADALINTIQIVTKYYDIISHLSDKKQSYASQTYFFNATINIKINDDEIVKMDIVTLDFEEPLMLEINKQIVQVIAFKTNEPGNIKFGIKAPRSVQVNREEIHQAIKNKREEDA